MQFEKCNRREHCITPMGQLKLSDGVVPILPLKFSVSCQCLCLHSMGRVCEFLFVSVSSGHLNVKLSRWDACHPVQLKQ